MAKTSLVYALDIKRYSCYNISEAEDEPTSPTSDQPLDYSKELIDMQNTIETNKACKKCGEAKPLSEYYKRKGAKDGHRNDCKACVLGHQKERYKALSKAPEHTCETSGCDQLSKVCTRCGEDKPLSAYSRRNYAADGHVPDCKECHSSKNREWYSSVKEANSAHSCDTSGCDLTFKDCSECGVSKPTSSFHRKADSIDGHTITCGECLSDWQRSYRADNPEASAAANKKYYESNKEIFFAANTRRQRLLADAVQEPYTREEIFARDNWICGLCEEPIDPELRHPDRGYASIDHIVPLSLGGDDTPANVQAAHFGCNSAKGNRVELEDLQSA